MMSQLKSYNTAKDVLHIKDENAGYEASINLREGGRIISWKQQEIEIIGEPGDPYINSFAAAVLVPYANRVRGGNYMFNDREYQLPTNENGINAIHGLVYNQTFVLREEVSELDETGIQLAYSYRNLDQGYPFSFDLELEYKFKPSGLELNLTVLNTGKQSFPLTLGWHPYFNLNNSKQRLVSFHPHSEFVMDDHGIPVAQKDCSGLLDLSLEDQELDTAYKLNSREFALKTDAYQLKFSCSDGSDYLQLFTPSNRNYLAIEPMTGISNSFNSGEGLRILPPGKELKVLWNMEVELTDY